MRQKIDTKNLSVQVICTPNPLTALFSFFQLLRSNRRRDHIHGIDQYFARDCRKSQSQTARKNGNPPPTQLDNKSPSSQSRRQARSHSHPTELTVPPGEARTPPVPSFRTHWHLSRCIPVYPSAAGEIGSSTARVGPVVGETSGMRMMSQHGERLKLFQDD